MSNSINTLSWMLGLLLAPHSLTLLGNLVGAYQYAFLIWLALAAGMYLINAQSAKLVADASQSSFPGNQKTALELLLLASRMVSTIALSTVLLVTAGFVFNETFVYWFPNFAFAFVLLGIVLVVHMWGRETALRLQVGVTSVVVLGILSLTAVGLWGGDGPVDVGGSSAALFQPHGIAASLLLFAGFDLDLNPTRPNRKWQARTVQWALLAAALVMGLWALVCLLYVPAAKLTDSFIPHLLTARSVQGEAGRAIMGVVVIAGSVAAVNALFKSLAELLAGFGTRWRLGTGHKWLHFFERPAVWASFIAAAVGLMMAGGMAGTDEIDLYVQAGFILWILYYGALNLAAAKASRRVPQRGERPVWVLPAIGAVAMAIGGGVLLTAAPDGKVLFNIFALLAILTTMGLITRFILKRAITP